MTDSIPKAASRPRRLDPFEAAFQIAQLSVKRSFKGARAWVCLGIVLLPAAVSLLVRGHGAEGKDQESYFNAMLGVYHFGIAVPFSMLLFATGFPWPEAEEGTLTYWFTSPVPRWTVLLGRYAASLLVGTAILCLDVLAIGLPLKTSNDAHLTSVIGASIATTLVAVPAYLALFQLSATWWRFAIVAGVPFILIENFVSIIPGAFARITLTFYVRSQLAPAVLAGSRGDPGLFRVVEPASSATALTVFAVVTVVALGLSLLLVETIEYRGRTSQP